MKKKKTSYRLGENIYQTYLTRHSYLGYKKNSHNSKVKINNKNKNTDYKWAKI